MTKYPVTAVIVRLAGHNGLYGYRRMTALLQAEIFHVNVKHVWIELLNERPLLITRRG